MAQYNLALDRYIYPTPGGAFHAVSAPADDPSRRILRSLLQKPSTPSLEIKDLQDWSGISEEEKVLDLLYHIQNIGWVQGLEKPLDAIDLPLEDQLPQLLKSMSAKGKVLLADHQGFYIFSHGFPHEVAEELSALSAELANLHERRSGVLVNNMGINSSAWAIVEASGNSQIGFWPLYIGSHRFVLVISGVPHFNTDAFVNLTWSLFQRYGKEA